MCRRRGFDPSTHNIIENITGGSVNTTCAQQHLYQSIAAYISLMPILNALILHYNISANCDVINCICNINKDTLRLKL
jgi:hypothetical protein